MKNKDDNPFILDIITAMQNRRSVRAFLKKEIPLALIHRILEAARWAPSGVNTQPWKVAVIGPRHRQKITTAILEAKEKNLTENPDYHYYPDTWVEPYKSRRQACGLALYSALNLKKEDIEKRKQQWYRNYAFFEAPAALLFYLDAALCKGSWIDMGMFLQNVMLAARAYDLETCAQAALAQYPDIIRNVLSLPADQHIVCGMAMGYADWSDPINQYRTAREPIDIFTNFYP